MAYRVLAVDDSATVRAVIAKSLKLSDVEVSRFAEASRGDQALKMIREEGFDLVFCDLNMPGMNGYDLVETLKCEGLLETTAVIIVSSMAVVGIIDELRMKGVRGYLRKPLRPEKFRQVVTQVMGACRES